LYKCNVGLWSPPTSLIKVGCKEYKSGFNLTQCPNTNFVDCGGAKTTNVGFFHHVFGDRVKSAWSPVYFFALTGLGQNSLPKWLPAYIRWWAFLPCILVHNKVIKTYSNNESLWIWEDPDEAKHVTCLIHLATFEKSNWNVRNQETQGLSNNSNIHISLFVKDNLIWSSKETNLWMSFFQIEVVLWLFIHLFKVTVHIQMYFFHINQSIYIYEK